MEPIGYVPVLVDEDIVLSDSFAILMVSGWTFIVFTPLDLILLKNFNVSNMCLVICSLWKRSILNIHCCLVIFKEEASTTRYNACNLLFS